MSAPFNPNPTDTPAPSEGSGFILTNPVSGPQEPESVGELLRAAREKAGRSAQDIANQLRMGLRQVNALERAEYEALPSGTFLRGFVRNYAKAVGVAADEALRILEKTHSDALAVKATSHVAPVIAAQSVEFQIPNDALATPKSRAIIAVLLVMCLMAVVWYWWEFVRPHRADGGRPKETQIAVQSAIDATPVNPVTAADSPVTDARTAQPTVPAALPDRIPTDANIATGVSLPATNSPISTPPAAPALPGSPAPSAPPSTLKTSSGEKASSKDAAKSVAENAVVPAEVTKPRRAGESGVLGFTFSGESWVEVIDGTGRTIISRRYKAGEADEVTGKGPFSVVVGNAATTRMAVNGREFDLAPHTRATVARVTVK